MFLICVKRHSNQSTMIHLFTVEQCPLRHPSHPYRHLPSLHYCRMNLIQMLMSWTPLAESRCAAEQGETSVLCI